MYVHCNIPVEEIKANTDIVDIVSQTVHLQNKGKYFRGLCPFHTEKHPSFSVWQSSQRYYCFGCGANGDVIDFIMWRDGLDFKSTLQLLSGQAGIGTGISPSQPLKDRKSLINADDTRVKEVELRLKEIVEDERLRLIGIEQRCHLFLNCAQNIQDPEHPLSVWALGAKDLVELYLDCLYEASPRGRLKIVKTTRGWNP